MVLRMNHLLHNVTRMCCEALAMIAQYTLVASWLTLKLPGLVLPLMD